MLTALALPVALLMIAAVLVTRLLERLVPENLIGLGLLTLLASLLMWGLASALFAGLYVWQDARLASLVGEARGTAHLLGLGAKAALIWGPLVLITVATAPRRWRDATW